MLTCYLPETVDDILRGEKILADDREHIGYHPKLFLHSDLFIKIVIVSLSHRIVSYSTASHCIAYHIRTMSTPKFNTDNRSLAFNGL